MSKRILTSLSIIGIVAAIAIGATTAYLSDVEKSSENTFTAGSLNLKVGDDDPTTWNFQVEDIKPGDSGSKEAVVSNTGSIDGYLHITFQNLLNDENGCREPEYSDEPNCDNDAIGELAKNLDLLIYLDENGNDSFTLGTDTLIYQGKASGILQGDLFNYLLASGDSKDFRVEWELPSSTNNEVQTDKTGFDVVFELTQNQKSIVGDWHFNENTGIIAYDSSGRGNNGTIHGASWTSGRSGAALSFDGVNDYVDCGNDSSLNPTDEITVEAWIYPKVDMFGPIRWTCIRKGDSQYLLEPGDIGTNYWAFGVNIGGTFKRVDTDGPIPIKQWHHFVGIYDSSQSKLQIWVDGVLRGSRSVNGSIQIQPGTLRIGKYDTWWNYEVFNGIIDEVRIYNRALTPDEIQQHYQAGL